MIPIFAMRDNLAYMCKYWWPEFIQNLNAIDIAQNNHRDISLGLKLT
jgi:hypothetical protein